MNFAINYVFSEVKSSDTYIKYPGTKWDLPTLRALINKKHKIVLHGVIPSSGSIIDPHLCDFIEEFATFVKSTDQKWLSFHFDHKSSYMSNDFDKTIENNISKIRKYCGDNIQILIENVPPTGTNQDWCMDPEVISEYCRKYDFGFLLDIAHLIVASKFRGEKVEEYLSKLPLGKVKEIHVSGCLKLPDGSYLDNHTECNSRVYKLLEYVLHKTPNCEMISIEYSPEIGDIELENLEKTEEYRTICAKQQLQLNRVKSIVRKTNL